MNSFSRFYTQTLLPLLFSPPFVHFVIFTSYFPLPTFPFLSHLSIITILTPVTLTLIFQLSVFSLSTLLLQIDYVTVPHLPSHSFSLALFFSFFPLLFDLLFSHPPPFISFYIVFFSLSSQTMNPRFVSIVYSFVSLSFSIFLSASFCIYLSTVIVLSPFFSLSLSR